MVKAAVSHFCNLTAWLFLADWNLGFGISEGVGNFMP
jgi:hypothetical protein